MLAFLKSNHNDAFVSAEVAFRLTVLTQAFT